jgi:hypothetical protein
MKNSKSPLGSIGLLALICATPLVMSQRSFGELIYHATNPSEWAGMTKIENYLELKKDGGRTWQYFVPTLEIATVEAGDQKDNARYIPILNIDLKDSNPEFKISVKGRHGRPVDDLIDELVYTKAGHGQVTDVLGKRKKVYLTTNKLFEICKGAALDACRIRVQIKEYDGILPNTDLGTANLNLVELFKRARGQENHVFETQRGTKVTFRVTRQRLIRPIEVSSENNHKSTPSEEPLDSDLATGPGSTVSWERPDPIKPIVTKKKGTKRQQAQVSDYNPDDPMNFWIEDGQEQLDSEYEQSIHN